ncbi:MAG: hypothetical protein WAM14_04060 [Candidatus Nitrosopolaris sp.]
MLKHTLIIRGFDDQVHDQLGQIANQRGVSINSIVKDAVDKWLKKQQSEVPRKHDLIIYSDDESITRMLKSMDRLAKEGNLFKCFFGPPHSPATKLLTKLKWYDGTVQPYYYSSQKSKEGQQLQIQSQKNIMKYCGKVIENVVKNASNKQVCCLDFLMNDVKKSSLKDALDIEKDYDDNRIAGLMYCAYKTDNLLNSEIKDLIELFEMHDQIFIVKEDEVYKLHLTKENVHKLFLS